MTKAIRNLLIILITECFYCIAWLMLDQDMMKALYFLITYMVCVLTTFIPLVLWKRRKTEQKRKKRAIDRKKAARCDMCNKMRYTFDLRPCQSCGKMICSDCCVIKGDIGHCPGCDFAMAEMDRKPQ